MGNAGTLDFVHGSVGQASQVPQWCRICLPTPEMYETLVPSMIGKIPWRRKWEPTPVFLPGESHGQRSLEGYSPWSCKESDTTGHILCQIFMGSNVPLQQDSLSAF